MAYSTNPNLPKARATAMQLLACSIHQRQPPERASGHSLSLHVLRVARTDRLV